MPNPLAILVLLGVMPWQDSLSRPHYAITMTLRSDGRPLEAEARIDVPAGAASLRLGVRGIGVTRITDSRGRAVRTRYNRDSSEVIVAGSDPVLIAYTVEPDTARYRQLGYHLFGSTGPDDAWYPVVAGHRVADFDVRIEAPPGLALLTTAGVGRKFEVAGVEGFALAYGPDVVTSTISRAGLEVTTLAPARDSAGFRRVGETTLQAAEWYQQTYGFFPVGKIGIVPGYAGARGGFPLPNVFMIHRGDLSPPFVRWITSHELAHYYWGLYVLDAEERLGWLSLGLGIWTDQLYLARTSGRTLAAAWRDPQGDDSFRAFAEASAAGHEQRLGLSEATVDSLPYDYNSLVRHGKAATGIYLLGLRLGEERFVQLQRRILREYRGRALSIARFGSELEREGVSGASDFLAAWTRGDASLGFRVAGVDRVASSRFRIRVRRTGTIPFPITLEARSPSGRVVRSVLDSQSQLDSVDFELDGFPSEVRIDPEGLLPTWSSDNLEMRRVFIRALGAGGATQHFLTMAREHLAVDPDPHVAAMMIERLFESGRYGDVTGLVDTAPALSRCIDRQTCMAALQAARAYARLDQPERARAMLAGLETAVMPFGRPAANRLQLLRQDLAARN